MLSQYKAVILAGGKGTRLYPVTKEVPKPLLPVKRRPIINHLVDLFVSQGIKDIAVSVSKDFLDDFNWWQRRYYPGLDIKFAIEETPLGTMGGLWYLKDWIGNSSFFLSNGDELKEINLLHMADFHEEKKPTATIALVKVPNPQDYGVAICEKGMIKEFLEKPQEPPSDYISSGLYLLTPDIFKYHPGPEHLMLEKNLFPALAGENKLAGFQFEGKWMDCGTWERYGHAIDVWEA